MRNLRPLVPIVALIAAGFLVCAAQNGPQTALAPSSQPLGTTVTLVGVTSDLGAKPFPRAPHVRRVTIAKERSRSAPAHVLKPPSTSPPPVHTGGSYGSLHAMVCSFGWSCATATCIVSRESGWNPRARNPSSGAAGLMQLMPFHWLGKFDPYDPYLNVRYSYGLYRQVGWSPWSGGGSCGV